MKVQIALFALATVSPSVAMLTPARSDPATLPSTAPDLDRIAGVYKHRFANANVQGEQYTSEDVFEVVKLSPRSAYVRIHGEFYNGHMCNLAGVADLEPDALVYHGPSDDQGHPCVLKFSVNKDGVIVNDVGGYCRAQTCGARGGYGYGGAVDYPFKARRTIRYTPLIVRSTEYATAIKAHAAQRAGKPGPAAP